MKVLHLQGRPNVCKSILAAGSSSPREDCHDSSPQGDKAQTTSQIRLSKLKTLAAKIQRMLKESRDNMDRYKYENPEMLPDLQAVGKQLLQDTYDAIIMWMDPAEIAEQMGPGMGGRADMWRQSTTSRFYTFLQSEQAACKGCDDVWQSRQKAIIKHLLTDIVSALDYMATVALQLSPEYCYASKAARESAMKAAYFPFEELAAAGIEFVQPLHNQGIKACRDEVAHQRAAELVFPDGKIYWFDLMALKGLHTNVGVQIRPFDVPGMHWLECILKARRRIERAFELPELLEPSEESVSPSLNADSMSDSETFLKALYTSIKPASLSELDLLAACSDAEYQDSNSDARAAWDTIDRDGRALLFLEKQHIMCKECKESMSDKNKIRQVTLRMLLKLIKDD